VTLINAYPVERLGGATEVAIGDLPAGDVIDLVFGVTASPDAIGMRHTVQLAAAWTDPTADARRTLAFSAPPLTLAEPGSAAEAPLDSEVAEMAARERADAERREAFRLDRAGKYAESRSHLRRSMRFLQMAPASVGVAREMKEVQDLMAFGESAPMPEAVRKRGVWDSHRRSRGKRHEPPGGGAQ
jgi:hypothetical protein